ncbi:MAG TPA: 3-hydroxyacyl-ACP dehydratase FabZ [Thermodesulfobacteriaceae bacterium]|nr:3-hydroxyacyl-ACP dehydratase FabZ [Thermodesulfobacteriaceae bacterium]
MKTEREQLGFKEISRLLPHRYPFLLVDRVLDVVRGKSIISCKNVSNNEPFFQGHFPGDPIMPGVLILEAMAQTGIIFGKLTDPEGMKNKLMVFAGIDNVRFRKRVVPGDRLIMELLHMKRKSLLWKMKGRATVEGELVAEAKLLAAVSN